MIANKQALHMSKADDQKKLQAAFSLHQAGHVDKAANAYREILKGDPNNLQALHYLGVIEATLGNIEQAKSLMGRSVSSQPQNIQFIENYAAILFQSEDYNAALKICQQGLQLMQSNGALLYISAISLFKLRRLQNSLAQFDKLLSIQPNHIVALNERGSVLAELKQYDASLESIEKALAIKPHYAEGYLNKGNLCRLLKRNDEAIVNYDKALALGPNLADAWLGRGNALRELRRYEEALAAFDRALAIRADLAEASAWPRKCFYRPQAI